MRARSGDQFGTGTTNINDQPLIRAASRVRHALINQARFFFTADDLNRTAEDFLRFSDKFAGIHCDTQGCRSDHADLRLRNILKAFGEKTQALPAALHCIGRKDIVAVQTGGQTHLAFNARERLDASRHLAYNQHMKTIRTEINCGVQRGGA